MHIPHVFIARFTKSGRTGSNIHAFKVVHRKTQIQFVVHRLVKDILRNIVFGRRAFHKHF